VAAEAARFRISVGRRRRAARRRTAPRALAGSGDVGDDGAMAARSAPVALVVERALRLVRKDLARLTDVHRAQFVAAIAPGKPELAESLIEAPGSDDDDDDAHGLVYLRLRDEGAGGKAYDGWLLDDERAPSRRARPDGGLFFVAGTTRATAVEMSRSSLHREGGALRTAIAAILDGLEVTVRGPALAANPPFQHATAPRAPKVARAAGTASLRVVRARRYTEATMRAAPEAIRFQFLPAVRPKFATPTTEGMESTFALGMLYGMIDAGSQAAAGAGLERRGLAHVRLAVDGDGELDGWFWLAAAADGAPSGRATATDGYLMLADSIERAGVAVVKGKVKVDGKHARPTSGAIARGLQRLGLTFELAG
jgi:hypothetical protein